MGELLSLSQEIKGSRRRGHAGILQTDATGSALIHTHEESLSVILALKSFSVARVQDAVV